MMYFTIPEDILGAGTPASDIDVYLDDGVRIPSSPSNTHNKFGDGYSITTPLGPRIRKFSGSFLNRETELINLIDNYFTYLEGEPINNFHILGVAASVVSLKWGKVYRAEEVYGLQADFEEQFR